MFPKNSKCWKGAPRLASTTGHRTLAPPGKVGEIVAGHKLGPDYILKEYYKDPAKTNEVIRGGYWHSGDLSMINEKGHLKFADRLKDYLRIGGENVSSSVVEAVLRKHPSVLEAAIVGHKGALGHDETSHAGRPTGP